MLDREPNLMVSQRDEAGCVACKLSITQVLAVHHRIPRSLGGTDVAENLCVLCSNCHRLVHAFSIGRRLEGKLWQQVSGQLEPSAAGAIASLAREIRAHRDRVVAAENRWIDAPEAKGSIPFAEAVDQIATRNGYEGNERREFIRAIKRLVKNTPTAVIERCSIRLLKGGRYLSINAGNHLLFRVPAFTDGGLKQDSDAFVVWPTRARMNSWASAQQDKSVAFQFKLFEAVNLAMSSREILKMNAADWVNYRGACEAAVNCRRTRDWPSNVTLDLYHLDV